MKKWNQLLIRHGWLLIEKEENVFDCKIETENNLEFLIQCLKGAGVNFELVGETLTIKGKPVSESEWIEVVDYDFRGRGEDLWFRPGVEEPKVRELDTYISGIVRQLNRLGFYTTMSCQGSRIGGARVDIVKDEEKVEQLQDFLKALGVREAKPANRHPRMHIGFRAEGLELLDLAEKMSLVQVEDLGKGVEHIRRVFNNARIEELLAVQGYSGREKKIREVVQSKLASFVDYIGVDFNGNLIAEKKYGTGIGPTILLSAHLDVVEEFAENRVIIKRDGIWSSSEGILGADDRAGIAVLLGVAERQFVTRNFKGTLKFAFTVGEENGLVGARGMDKYFLHGIDAAIVVDRRGTSDIVTSNWCMSFCDARYGEFIEKVAEAAGLDGWKCTQGGSSDTAIWATNGIQSVNLSVGYRNEHTEDECLDVGACFDTLKLIEAILGNGNELRKVLREIKRSN